MSLGSRPLGKPLLLSLVSENLRSRVFAVVDVVKVVDFLLTTNVCVCVLFYYSCLYVLSRDNPHVFALYVNKTNLYISP